MRWMLLLCIIMFIYALHSLLTSSFVVGITVHHIIPSTYISWAMAAACCMQMQLACRLALALRDISQQLPMMPTTVFSRPIFLLPMLPVMNHPNCLWCLWCTLAACTTAYDAIFLTWALSICHFYDCYCIWCLYYVSTEHMSFLPTNGAACCTKFTGSLDFCLLLLYLLLVGFLPTTCCSIMFHWIWLL